MVSGGKVSQSVRKFFITHHFLRIVLYRKMVRATSKITRIPATFFGEISLRGSGVLEGSSEGIEVFEAIGTINDWQHQSGSLSSSGLLVRFI